MTGLDNILKKIEKQAHTQADSILEEARRQAEEIRQQGRVKAQKQAQEIAAQGEKRAADILARARSSSMLAKRQTELAIRQRLIRESIGKARQRLQEMPAGEYFAVLKNLAAAHALPQAGEIILSPEDRRRMPDDFEATVNAALSDPRATLTISSQTRPIGGGMILAYGDIEDNCSFDALFEDKADALQDLVQALLFSGS